MTTGSDVHAGSAVHEDPQAAAADDTALGPDRGALDRSTAAPTRAAAASPASRGASPSDRRRVMGVQQRTVKGSQTVGNEWPTHASTRPPRPDDTVEVVRGFLRDVRSGRALHLAPRYLADQVLAHQGPPGAGATVIRRSPQQYAEHVADLQREHGPWDFELLRVAPVAGGVIAHWRQVSSHRRQRVEHGRATYRVEDGLITEYWIQAAHSSQRVGQTRGCRTVDVTRHVSAPPHVVWRLLTDMDSWAQWGPWSDARTASPTGPSVRLSRRTRLSTLEQVVDSVPERRLSFETLAGAGLHGARTDVSLAADVSGTTVWWHVALDGGPRSVVAQPLMTLFANRVLQLLARQAEHLERLDRAFGFLE